ncbi:type IV secretion system protein [Steroidobacter sp. S1-65]|uniref:Type IV secretion system protein n=1 Tax=Steroidobacter gossypii TaxID=2805490 RepID=A0ABS1WXT9_9GAMM|nr:type IV secretion system protein [Steroidobacter gossypii]MBM0105791.1 type IV secretion system protein [Steroidobacter gossypii]
MSEVDAYLAEAASWDADREAHRQATLRTTRWVACAGWACAMAATAAIVVMSPLKQTQPFLIRVDSATGVVDTVPVFAGSEDLPQALTRHLLTLYVTTCERFNFATAESDYAQCGSFHSAERNQAWAAAWARSNPSSPLNLYKDGTTVRAQVRSVSFFERGGGQSDLAQVRYMKVRRVGGNGVDHVSYWVATIRYAYASSAELTGRREWSEQARQQRAWNPLGFRILDFKPEPEVLGQDAATGTAATHPTSTHPTAMEASAR